MLSDSSRFFLELEVKLCQFIHKLFVILNN